MQRKLFPRVSFLGLRTLMLVILSLLLMFGNYRLHYFKSIRSVLSIVVAPVQYLVNWPIKLIAGVDDYFTGQYKLLADNAALHTQNLLLQAKVQKILALEKENTQLRALLSSSSKIGGKVLVAQVLSINSNPFDPQIVLDKGSSNKVYEGQPVLGANGVMGQIIEVGPITSRVLLITSTRSAVPVQDNRNGMRAIAAGDGSGRLKLMYVPDTADIKVGDVLVTSGLGLTFPQGYPVGVVHDITHPPEEQFAAISVIPAAKINRSRQVLLVWK